MPAKVICKKENKKEITEFLQKELVNLLDMINEEKQRKNYCCQLPHPNGLRPHGWGL